MKQEKSLKKREISGGRTKGKKCPFIEASFRECYCNSMSSLKTDDAIYYCGGHYEECGIFMRKASAFPEPERKIGHPNVR